MDYDLHHAAKRLGITRPQLIKRMKDKGLLDSKRLPSHPLRDKLYMRTKAGQWFHEKLGMQYSQSTRITAAGIPWLADQLGIERPAPPAEPDRRYVA